MKNKIIKKDAGTRKLRQKLEMCPQDTDAQSLFSNL